MKTRVGKIARLPYQTREKLNLRLLNGELGAPLLQWLNELPETRDLINTCFAGRPVSKQNLSEWRHGGYQDWLRHQHRQECFQQMSEQGRELMQDEGPDDGFEYFSRVVLAEMAENLNDLHKFRNRNERWQRLREIARDLARLQHGYNHSRKVALSWKKWKVETGDDDETPPSNQEEQKSPVVTPSSAADTTAVKPGQSESNQNNSTAVKPHSRDIYHRKCGWGCICKDCHPDDGPYPYARAVRDYEESRKPEYWALGNDRSPLITNLTCDCECDCAKSLAWENRKPGDFPHAAVPCPSTP